MTSGLHGRKILPVGAITEKTPVKTAFAQAGLSQVFAARLLGMSYTKLSRIVNRQCRVSPEDKRAIAIFLRKPVEELFPDEVAA